MAEITVQLYTTIRKKLVKDKIPARASNVAEAMISLENRFGPELKKELYSPDGSIKGHYIVSLNGYPVDRKSPDTVKVQDNDVLLIYPAVSGG